MAIQANSTIHRHPRGAGTFLEPSKSAVYMRIAPHGSLTAFSMLVTGVQWHEGEHHSVQSTIGGDNYMFLTGSKPVPVTITGVVIYPACVVPYKLSAFWDTYRASEHRKPIKMLLDGRPYWIMITDIRLEAHSTENDTEQFILTGVGVPAR